MHISYCTHFGKHFALLGQYLHLNSNNAMCRHGGWSCVGRKDRKKCEEESLLHYTNTNIDYCNSKHQYLEHYKYEGYKLCSTQKPACVTPVRDINT